MITTRQPDTPPRADSDLNANLPETNEGSNNGSKPRKQPVPMVWIPATICVGLLIAAVYLGGRIVTSHPHAHAAVKKAAPAKPELPKAEIQKAEIPKTAIPQAAPVVERTSPPKAEVKVKTVEPAAVKQVAEQVAGDVPLINPKGGERYIQIGALDQERTRRYLVHLRQANLAPHVAPGPTPELLRILIGPFSDQNSLIAAKNGLDTAGIENFVRNY